jgi:glycine cleavage system H protein
MSTPTDRRYLETHEWHQPQGDTVTIGITQFAADELTDITFVQLPKIGAKISANKAFGEIESVKATSDLYSGVGGDVIAVNEKLTTEPGLVNRDPYAAGWMIKIKVTDPADLTKLLSTEDYLKKTGH